MPFSEQEINEFKTEALDLLEEAEKSLLSLDNGGEFIPHYDSVFRTYHSLKGAAGMMELSHLQEHMHQLESILVRFKETLKIPKEYIELFLKGTDAARLILSGQEVSFSFNVKNNNEGLDSALNEFLSECDEISERVSSSFQLLEKGHTEKELIDSVYRDIHSLKGAAQLFGFKQMGDLVHAMESSLEKFRGKNKPIPQKLIDILFHSIDLIDQMVSKIRQKHSLAFESQVGGLVSNLINSADASPQIEKNEPPVFEKTPQATVSTDAEKESASTIRVSVSLLDRLMTLMGEMVLVRNQVLQYSNNSDDLEFLNLSQRLNVVTSEIQGEMMKTRMQPIGNVIGKFNRVVRDLAKDLNKKVELHLSGRKVCPEAQILALADKFDELTLVVDGKARKTPLEAIEEIQANCPMDPASALFDPEIIKKLVLLFKKE